MNFSVLEFVLHNRRLHILRSFKLLKISVFFLFKTSYAE